MAETHWYELRVAGSAGTKSERAGKEGIAMAESGRLCAVSSGNAMKFATEQQAVEFLSSTSLYGIYEFEPVRVEAAPSGSGADTRRL